MPALLVVAPLAFYAALFATGYTLEEAREAGWVSKPQVHMLLQLAYGICCLHHYAIELVNKTVHWL